MKLLKKIYILSLTMIAALISGCSGTGPDGNSGDRGILEKCPERPNCVSSQATDKKHKITPFYFRGNPAISWDAIVRIVNSQPRTAIVRLTDRYLHAECRSRIGFIDDLELLSDPETGVIDIRSASRSGYYDLGVNRRRVSLLGQQLKDNGFIQ